LGDCTQYCAHPAQLSHRQQGCARSAGGIVYRDGNGMESRAYVFTVGGE
jgi:hypothetical protein